MSCRHFKLNMLRYEQVVISFSCPHSFLPVVDTAHDLLLSLHSVSRHVNYSLIQERNLGSSLNVYLFLNLHNPKLSGITPLFFIFATTVWSRSLPCLSPGLGPSPSNPPSISLPFELYSDHANPLPKNDIATNHLSGSVYTVYKTLHDLFPVSLSNLISSYLLPLNLFARHKKRFWRFLYGVFFFLLCISC